jgi:elongator complex protein 3
VANRTVKAISEIVEALIQAHKARKNVDLSSLKQRYASRNNLSSIPKTVDIIAAIPENYKKQILPKIKAKPVRTASGVRISLERKFEPGNYFRSISISAYYR